MANHLKARIIGTGSFLPEKILSNEDLEKIVDTSDEWIVSRTGMKERRIAGPEEHPSDMGFISAKKALEDANLPIDAIDFIIVATMTPDYITPSTAALIQAKLGAPKIAVLDIQAACTGFLYALSLAKAYVESGMYKNILVIATEKLSSVMNYKDRTTCVLFGDGASAAVVSGKGTGLKIDSICLGADGELGDLLIIPGGGARNPTSKSTIDLDMHFLRMDGKEVFKHAVRRMSSAAKECLEKAGLKDEDISWIVPHQANIRIIEALAKGFNISHERVYKTIHKYGNTSASSVAIALEELMHQEKIEKDEHLLLVGFGAGLTWGAIILTKIEA